MISAKFGPLRKAAFALVLAATQALGPPASAQVLTTQAGRAAEVDLVKVANDLSMQDAYARSLFLFLQSNPNLFNDQQFYVSFVSFLLSRELGNNCRDAFANEFERRDYFTKSFSVLPQLQQIVAGRSINRNFEVSFKLQTGQYDFTAQNLPVQSVTAVGQRLESNIRSGSASNCAQQLLAGTEVSTKGFPWDFRVVDESGQPGNPRFPFSRALKLSSADARTLFETFGRQLYSIVAYQVRAANDGSKRIQVIPTDAQLFGLADSAVVRVETYAHPTLSQPNYLDISSPLTVRSEPLGLLAELQFEQQGFRAVATGTAQGRGTGVTAAANYPVEGSAAVAGSSFILRMTAPQISGNVQGLQNIPGAPRFLTLFGGVEFNRVTARSAPVTGQVTMLQVEPGGALGETSPFAFSGSFTAAAPQSAEVAPVPAPTPAPTE